LDGNATFPSAMMNRSAERTVIDIATVTIAIEAATAAMNHHRGGTADRTIPRTLRNHPRREGVRVIPQSLMVRRRRVGDPENSQTLTIRLRGVNRGQKGGGHRHRDADTACRRVMTVIKPKLAWPWRSEMFGRNGERTMARDTKEEQL
jgi:hypothetical protein